jgi:multiple sugar transport system substrate-binding protein
MAKEIEFSVMPESADQIQPLLDQFEAEHHIHVRLRLLTWDTAWSDLVKVALYRDNLDVSEVGSTWLGDLIGMDALHPFSRQEIQLLDKETAFLPEAWRGGALATDPQQWGIPWLVGTRLLHYRRDLLARAGIDEQTAFQSGAQLPETFKRLQANGVKIPWIIPTRPVTQTILNVFGWIWDAGGDLVTPDGKQTLFSEPAARAGIQAYFALGRYLAREARNLDDGQVHQVFLHNPEAAVTLGTFQLFLIAREQNLSELTSQLGIAPFPGPAYLGGSYLVVWKHSPRAEAALKLIRFLTQTPAQVNYSQCMGLVPVRLEALTHSEFTSDPLWQAAIKAVRQSRSFPAMRSWGIIQDKLVTEFGSLWAEVLTQPDLDLDTTIQRRLEVLAKRLDLSLRQR